MADTTIVLYSLQAMVRFAYPRKLTPEQGLWSLTQNPDAPLDIDLVGFILIAIRGKLTGLSSELTELAFDLSKRVGVPADPPNVSAPLLSAAEITSLVADRLCHDGLKKGTFRLPPLNPVDVARAVLEFCRQLWEPTWLQGGADYMVAAIASNSQSIAHLFSDASALGLLVWMKSTITIGGVPLKVNPDRRLLAIAWSHASSLLNAPIPAEAFRALLPDRTFPELNKIDIRPPVVSRVDPALLRGLAVSLARQAAERAVYAPRGLFELLIPNDLGFRDYGVLALQVYVTDDALYYRHVRSSVVGPIYWWRADEINHADPDTFFAWSDVVCAALWHDLHVSGEVSFRKVTSRKRPRNGTVDSSHLPPPKAPLQAITLPRAIVIQGTREWGTSDEREYAAKRMHGVAGHLRRLARGWTRSLIAEDAARDFGIVLPDGFTFVKPFVRGGEAGDTLEGARPTLVKSRGLTSLIALGLTSLKIRSA